MRTRALAIKLLIIVAALGLLWSALGFWAVPPLVRSLATGVVQERLQRALTIGEIRFNPYRLELTLNDLSLPDADGKPLISWQQLQVSARLWASVWMRGPHLRSLQIDGLAVQAIIGKDGQLNLADLAKLAGPDTSDDTPLRLAVDRLALNDGQIGLQELDRPKPFALQLKPIRFELTNFSTLDEAGNGYHFVARSDAGEELDWSGKLQLDPFRSSGVFSIAGLQVTTLARYLGEQLPLVLSSGNISLNGDYRLVSGDGPLQLQAGIAQLAIKQLGLRARETTQDSVQLDSIVVAGVKADITTRNLTIERVALQGGAVNATLLPDGHLNLLDLAGAPSAPAAPAAPSAGTGEDWRYALQELAIDGLRVELLDQTLQPNGQLQLADVSLGITGLSNDLKRALPVKLGLQVGESGNLQLDGQLHPDSLDFKGLLKLADIDLRAAQPYLQQHTAMTLLNGRLSAQLQVQHSAKSLLDANGNVDVRDLRSIDNELRQDFVKWQRLQALGVDYRSNPQRLRIREIVAQAPYARVIVGGDRTLNLTHILNPGAAPVAAGDPSDDATPQPAPAAVPAAPPLDMAIGQVRIENGSANFEDLWIKPNFAVGIGELKGTIVGLSSAAGTRAKVDLRGTVDRYAPALINGEINLLSATAYSDMALKFSNMELTTVTPYSGYFAGYQIRKGKLNVDLSYKIDNRKLNAGHHVVINQLELGDKVSSPEATTLPVRLAVALLKDRNGVIDIDLPITGTLDDPKFRVGPIIWKAFVNLLVKVVASPFTFIGNLFGGNDTEVNQIGFEPGLATLDDGDHKRLATLASALTERPALELEIPAAWSAEFDRPAILQRRLAEQLQAAAATAGTDRYQQLLSVWRAEAGTKAELPPLAAAREAIKKHPPNEPPPDDAALELQTALLARWQVAEIELEELGRARATAILDALLQNTGIEPARLFVINAKPASVDAQQLRIDLLLK